MNNKFYMLTVATLALMTASANAQTANTAVNQTATTVMETVDMPTPSLAATGTIADALDPNLPPLPAPTMMAPPPPPAPILSVTSPDYTAINSTMVANGGVGLTDRIINLRDAVAVGVLTNPQTEAVENNRRATDEELRQAKALYLPSIDLQADAGYQFSNENPDLGDNFKNDFRRIQGGVTLTQMLFDGFNTDYENARQKWRVRSASHRVRETTEVLGLDIVESYIDLLRQRELLAIASENTKQHIDILAQIEDATGAGRSTVADVQQTRARLASARATEANVAQSLRSAENNYRRRVGDAPQHDLIRPLTPRELLNGNIEDEVKEALTQSPTLDIAEADVNVAQKEREQTKSTLYPQVDLVVNGNAGDNLEGVHGDQVGGSALVRTNWNLFRGGADQARIRELTYRHAQVKNSRDAAARTVENDVRQTWASMNAAGTRAEQFRAQAAANAEVVQAYKDQFNLDRRTLLDVLDSQNEWFVSRSNAINNEYLEMFASYRLLSLKGKLLPYLGVSYPKESVIRDRSSGNMNTKSGSSNRDAKTSDGVIPNWIAGNKS
jgi:adhesin transport system outer membrane protein